MNCNEKIAKYLYEHGITQTFLANKTGISVKIINAIVNCSRKVTADELGTISKALDVSADIFLD